MIYRFDSSPLPTLAKVGGKGLSLIKMAQAGLPVPPGFICGVTFFEPWLTALQATPEWTAVQSAIQNNKNLHPSTVALKAACANLALTNEQEQQLKRVLPSLPRDSFYAVRSSSPEEDLEGASFAGGYKSSLGVTQETMLDALRASFASAFDERVFVYKEQQGFSVDNPRIAVVVQQQIASEAAGVGFSLNPLNNDYDEAVIDANWGLGESVVAGMVTPDHFVVDKVSKAIVERALGGKETVVSLTPSGGIQEQANPDPGAFCLTGAQAIAITEMLIQIETLYDKPIDIEWAFADDTLYLLQARPITAYFPLASELMTEPGERRTLYYDLSLSDALTMSAPISRLTIDWLFSDVFPHYIEPFTGPITLNADGNPHESVFFAAGARVYMNLSQLLTIMNLTRYANFMRAMDGLVADLLGNVDGDMYRAQRKSDSLRWGALLRSSGLALWHSRRYTERTISAMINPRRFYEEEYEPQVTQAIHDLKSTKDDDLPLAAFAAKYASLLKEVFTDVIYPTLTLYTYHAMRIPKLVANESPEVQALADRLGLGAEGNEVVDLGIQLYRMSQMLTTADFAELEQLASQLDQRQLPDGFLKAWDRFVEQYGFRGPAEMDLASVRYGDDPLLALEQMSYMVDSSFDPEAMMQQNVAERNAAYEKLMAMFGGRKRRKLQKSYKIVELLAKTRDTFKYMVVLYGGAIRQRMLREGKAFVAQGRLDQASDIFDLKMTEIRQAHADPTFDLRQARAAAMPFYEKLRQVKVFPHFIDSRGRMGQVPPPDNDDPNTFVGLGVSRGVATGRIKVLHTPREKPVKQGDVLVAYTTDPGWTPLFVNAEAIILEVGGMLQHGGVVAREYGKPCVAGIQGITTTLQDGQLVEVDGTTGVVRLLDE